jgi:hypothetical protein
MENTLNIEKGTVLYKRSDGSEIVFTKMDDEDFYGFVRNPKGKVFEEQLLGSILRRGDWEATYEPVKKHGDHDQLSHGNRDGAGGGEVSPKTIKTIIERMSETKTPGITIDLKTGNEARTGYICSKKGFEKQVKLGDFDANKKKVIEDYIDKNMEELSKKGAFFGGWVVKSEDRVYLDVSRKFDTRQDAVRAMFDNEQDAIFDVKNDSYIYRKDEKDDRTNKAIYGGSSNTYKGYDERRERRFYRKNLESDRGESLNEDSEHVCLGRYGLSVKKHGDHDQSTHGSWAVGRFPKDSVPKARNGAKDYAYKKGIKQDDTIDYNKVVANRERASKIADIYETLPKLDRDAIDEYESLSTEVEEQFDFMTKELGIKVEFVKDDPYKTSKEMFDDASKGVLKVLSTESTGAHPLFSNAQNDKFRAVHDYFGHAATGRGFGQDGEEAAWVHHSQMFTEKARGALTTETRGQNSFFNNRGKQFADQKVALLPEEFWKVPVSFTKNYAVIYFDYGLKPVFKHEGHEDQSSHGNWARGFTEQEISRIEAMDKVGPSDKDILQAIKPKTYNNKELSEFVLQDSDLYADATQGIDDKVAQSLASLQAEFPNREYTEQEKNDIFARVQNEMVENYVESQKESLTEYGMAIEGYEPINTDDLVEPFNEVFGVVQTGESLTGDTVTLESKIERVYKDGNELEVRGSIYDENNNQVGEIARTFFVKDGTLNVEHGLLWIYDEENKGTGFGKEFIQQSEAWYTAKGLGYIEIKTTAEDGARHWARAGYDFAPNKVYENLDKISQRVASMDDEESGWFAKGSPERIEFDNLMSRATNEYSPYFEDESGYKYPAFSSVKDLKADDFPLPAHFANIGYSKEKAEEVGTWAGKELMYDLKLSYVKSLTAEGQKLLEGPIDHDGDGLIYDGTAREKPAPTKKN